MARRLQDDEAHRKFRSYVRALFELRSTSAIERALRDLRTPVGYRIYSKVVYSPTDALLALRGELDPRTLSAHGPSGSSFELRWKAGRDREREVLVYFAALPTDDPRIRALTTVASSDQWRALLRFSSSAYPRLVPTYLAQSEIVSGILRLKDSQSQSFDLRVKQLLATEDIRTADARRKVTRSIREWTDESISEAFAKLQENKRTLKSIQVGFFRKIGSAVDVSPSALAKVSRAGEVAVSGDFEIAQRHVITHFAQVGMERLRRFANRSLRETKYMPRPLEMYFERPYLEDVQEVRRLVTLLERYPSSNHSVPHGNPFARATVTDRYDGSSFEVWSVTGNSIILIPRLRATEAATGRLVHYLATEFAEGDVRDYGDA